MEIAEQELLEGVKNSDKSAFKEIYYKHQPILFRYVVYRVRNREVAEDITQETFVRIWNNRSQLDPSKSFFSLIAKVDATSLCSIL